MTKIYLKKDSMFGYSELSVCGHSGYSDEGSDIICAYISSACELLLNILLDNLHIEAETDINPENAIVKLKISPTKFNIDNASFVSLCMDGFASQMKEFSNQFPKFVSITIA
ncbi:MAG: ribosomal-processing cysteine protease Prp [Clostridia bacterium]|nr:ribosomal-processing cysteine protease Prp [Clostridia bacterium]